MFDLSSPLRSSVVRTALWALSPSLACQPSSEGSSSESSSSEDGDDTLAEGCWDRHDSGYYSDPSAFEPFACPSLPIPCERVEVATVSCGDCPGGVELDTGAMTPADIATADTNARCVAAGLRDAALGTYEVAVSEDQGFSGYTVRYMVLDVGAVGSVDYELDLDAGRYEAYRQLHPPAYYDACATAADLLGVLACLDARSEGGRPISGIDEDACIDAEPTCPA